MADTALTVDQALNIPLADDAPINLVPVNSPAESQDAFEDYSEAWTPDEGQGASAELPESGNGITLEDAMKISLADDEHRATEQPVAIIDGYPVTLGELVRGYADNARLGATREALSREAESIVAGAHGIVEAGWKLAGIVSDKAPPPPDVGLSYTNPSLFIAQKALREAIDMFIHSALEPGQEAQEAASRMVMQRHYQLLAMEERQLVEHFPDCADPEGREAFFDSVRDACHSCGFSEDDMRQAVDHRLFRLAHLASIGFEAQERRQLALPKPRKRRRRQKSDAMARLERTGSMEAAMAVDFD